MKCLAVGNRVELVDPEVEIVPGVSIIPTPGETPYHISVEFFSGSERLICVCDALHMPIDVDHPDGIPETYVASNREILKFEQFIAPIKAAAFRAGRELAFWRKIAEGHATAQANAAQEGWDSV